MLHDVLHPTAPDHSRPSREPAPAAAAAPSLAVLSRAEWSAAQRAHEERVDAALAGVRARRARGESHPVEDFLFRYYSFSPGALRRWHPGVGVGLADAAGEARASWRGYVGDDAGVVTMDRDAFLDQRGHTVRFVVSLLRAVLDRAPHYGCLGLHEWAMVYRAPEGTVRHETYPLRLGAAGTDAVVESHPVRCTHFDAYRFFTPEAAPLNLLRPTRQTQEQLDQPACLHAGMDLYKWAHTLTPAVPSELVMDCFEHARALRELDMRASPYDLSALGYEPVRIETAQGKAEYVAAQRNLAALSQQLRRRLLDAIGPLGPA